MSFHLVPAVVVGVDDEEVDLAAGSQHIIPYQLIADLIQKHQVQLIWSILLYLIKVVAVFKYTILILWYLFCRLNDKEQFAS